MMNLDRFGELAADTAMKGAADYLVKRGIRNTDHAAVCEALKVELRAALPRALDDAKEALEAGMSHAAVATFLASMRLAGVAAVNAVYPKEG